MISIQEKLPSTRYVGSKRKISDWVIDNIKTLEFDNFLDAFGGTGIIGYRVKKMNKKVVYNDKLKFNFTIGKSLIENNDIKLAEKDLEFVLKKHSWIRYPKLIQKTFKGIYYTDKENKWLDLVTTNIRYMNDDTKKSIAFNALFQSCIIKRPYNLFHRKNLYMRFARKVERSFGNKNTWDKPFEKHFKTFVNEINSFIFDNGEKNKSLNRDVFDLPKGSDVVYIDSPYMSPERGGVDYKNYYHFLEGLVNYSKWDDMIDDNSSNKRMFAENDIWLDMEQIKNAFNRLFKKFKKSTLVVSYRSGGIPTEFQIRNLLEKYKDEVIVKRKIHKYPLSPNFTKELLFIAT